jgi:hypothetical protein
LRLADFEVSREGREEGEHVVIRFLLCLRYLRVLRATPFPVHIQRRRLEDDGNQPQYVIG